MMDDINSMLGDTEHSMNENGIGNSLDESLGDILCSVFSEIEDAGSLQRSGGEVKDNVDISNFLETVLNCDNNESTNSLESESDSVANVGPDYGDETKKRKFNETLEDDDKESCEGDTLFEDLSKALGGDDYNPVNTEYNASYDKENIKATFWDM